MNQYLIFDKGEINYNMKKIISLFISFIISITTIYCVSAETNVTIKDATLVAKYICHVVTLDAEARACADMNNDGMINIKDVTTIQKFLLG